MGVYAKGQSVVMRGLFTDVNGAPVDPTTVRCKVETPADADTTYTYGVDAGLTKNTTGDYQLILSATLSGTYTYRWEGVTGAATPAVEQSFTVSASEF